MCFYCNPFFYENRDGSSDKWFTEVAKVSNRDFTTGFFFHKPNEEDHNYGTSSYIRNYEFIGIVKGYYAEKGQLVIEQRNRFKTGDKIEIQPPEGEIKEFILNEMFDSEGNKIDIAPHAQMEVRIPGTELPDCTILRKVSEH
jgi:putative protease